MTGEPDRIVVLGGSFDPIHLGHLRLAEEARRALAADRVILVPAAAQPLKAGPGAGGGAGAHAATAADRLAMARLAAQGLPWLEVSDIEVRRPGRSYTVETLEALRRELGPGPRLFFVAGADVLADLEWWYRIDDVLALAEFVVASRPGHAPEVPPRLRGRVRLLPIEALPISSTEVRDRIRRGLPVDAFLPPPVAAYIRARGLYS